MKIVPAGEHYQAAVLVSEGAPSPMVLVEVCRDDIRPVGLDHTEVRLTTTRRHRVDEMSGGLYAQSAIQWRP